MKLNRLLVLCLVFYTSLAKEEDILKLTDSDFESRISEYEAPRVMFYTPWCGNCKKLKPEYAKAADDLVRNDPPELVSFERLQNFPKAENDIPVDLYCWYPIDVMHESIQPTGTSDILWKNCVLSCSVYTGDLKNFTTVDAAVLEKLKTGFKKLKASEYKSLLKKYLAKEVFDNLKAKKTSFGSTLFDIIQIDLENIDSCIGISAPDAEAYTVFVDLFEPVIEDYYDGFKKTDKDSPSNYGDTSVFGNLDFADGYIVSSRMDRGRSIKGYLSNPCSTKKSVAYTCRFRLNNDTNKSFPEWCKKEDHLRVMSMRMENDLGQVYRRLVTTVNEIESSISFSKDERLRVDFVCRRQHIDNE